MQKLYDTRFLFWDVARCCKFVTTILGQSIGPIFKDAWPFKTEPTQSQNIINKLSTNAAQHPRKARTSNKTPKFQVLTYQSTGARSHVDWWYIGTNILEFTTSCSGKSCTGLHWRCRQRCSSETMVPMYQSTQCHTPKFAHFQHFILFTS
jgi:hypothetical protein